MRKLLTAASVLAAGLAFASAAQAATATIKIGELAPNGTAASDCTYCSDFQVSVATGVPGYAVPVGDSGTITAWSMLGPPSGDGCDMCGATMFVVRPNSTPGDYTFVGESDFEAPPADGQPHTYSTNIPVLAGDLIGLEYTDVPAYIPSADAPFDRTGPYQCEMVADTVCDSISPDEDSQMSVTATVTYTAPQFLGSHLAGTTLSSTSSGHVSLHVSCSSTAVTACNDKFGVYTATGTLPLSGTAHRAHPAVLLGTATYTVGSGATDAEHLKLNASGRARLAAGHFSARILITASDDGGRKATTDTHVTIKKAAAPHHASLLASLLSLL